MKKLSIGNRSQTINESMTMKRIYSFMFATIAAFAAASCAQELENNQVPAGETVTFTAVADGVDTKAALNEETKYSEWEAGDAITVHNGTKGFEFKTEKAGSRATFSYTGNDFGGEKFLAVYPSGKSFDVANKVVKAYIPTWQQAKAGTYNHNAAVAVAYSENDLFNFKNATALLKFTVNTDNVTHVVFHGNGSEAITGDVNITLGEEGVETVQCLETEFTEDKWNEETQQNDQVTVNKYGTWVECYAWDDNSLVDDPSDDTKYFTKGQTYYIAVAPQVFDGGVTVKFRIDEGEELVVKTTTKPVETKINTILNLGEIKYEAPATVEKVYLQPGVWSADNAWFSAHFFNSVGGAEDVKMTDEDADGVYEVSVPAGMESVIFCRMNPAYSDFAWNNETETDHVWTEMSSVAIPLADDTKVYYNVTDWEAGEWSETPQENTPDQPEVVEKEWGIVGTMTDWSDNIPMTLVDGWYVAENVTIKTSDEFKFRVGTTWDELKTYNATTIVDDTEYPTVDGQGDGNGMKVAVSAIYSVYLSEDATTMKVVKTGDIPLPEVKNWGIVGSITSWGAVTDITMALEGDWYIAPAVEMPAGTEFKFRVDNTWASDGGEELTYAGSVVSGTEYNVSGGASNISITSGAVYDVYLSRDETKMKVVKVADLPEPDIMAKDGYVYLLPNSNWTQASARFAIYLCNGSKTATWISMTKVDGTAYYEAKLPDDFSSANYKNIIFVRMNPSSQTNNWDNKWNQSGDLDSNEIVNGKNCCAIKAGQWDCGSNVTWSTVTKLN